MSKPGTGLLARSLALSVASFAFAQAGVITVTPVVTPNGSLFHYNYTITNGTGIDIPVLDISVPSGVLTIQNLTAPQGFQSAYDSGLGLVSFLEDTFSFGPSAKSGFAFDSPGKPGGTTFTATFFDGSTSSGPTTGPVPEPASLTLMVLGGAALLIRRISKV